MKLGTICRNGESQNEITANMLKGHNKLFNLLCISYKYFIGKSQNKITAKMYKGKVCIINELQSISYKYLIRNLMERRI